LTAGVHLLRNSSLQPAEEIEIPDQSLPALLEAVILASMRSEAEKRRPGMEQTWHGGARTFFFKGPNGRSSDLLGDEELLLYEQTASRVLTPTCRRWLEQGRAAQYDEPSMTLFRSLSNRSFALLWLGQTTSSIGDFL
jgi:hypothetical protein